jgi:hypothetical protein
MKLKIVTIGIMIIALTACSDDDGPTFNVPDTVDVITVSGVMITLDGTLARPCATKSPAEGGNDYLVTETIYGINGIRTEYAYTSSDGSCTGTEIIDAEYKVTFTAGDVISITGWHNLDGADVEAPQAQDDSAPLLDNEAVTSLTLTIDSVFPADPDLPGTVLPAFYVVDDTIPDAPVLYGISDYDILKAFNVPMTPQ